MLSDWKISDFSNLIIGIQHIDKSIIDALVNESSKKWIGIPLIRHRKRNGLFTFCKKLIVYLKFGSIRCWKLLFLYLLCSYSHIVDTSWHRSAGSWTLKVENEREEYSKMNFEQICFLFLFCPFYYFICGTWNS